MLTWISCVDKLVWNLTRVLQISIDCGNWRSYSSIHSYSREIVISYQLDLLLLRFFFLYIYSNFRSHLALGIICCVRLCHHCHSKTKKKEGEKGRKKLKDTTDMHFPRLIHINIMAGLTGFVEFDHNIHQEWKNILLLLSLSAKQKHQAFNENVGLKYCVLQILWRTAFLCSLRLLVFWGKVEAKAVKGCCISIIPQQEGENLFPELFRGLMECTTAKHRGWDWAALLWRLSSEFFSLKTPPSLLPGFLA